MFEFFDFSDIYTEWYWVVIVTIGWLALLIASAVIVAKVKKEKIEFTTRELTYGAICIAIAFTLSYVTAYKMPYGGSVTIFSVVPIIIFCYYFGYSKGVLVASVYTLLQFVQGPYVVHAFSALLDYIIPYTALAAAGLFCYNPKKEHKNLSSYAGVFIGASIYICIRYMSHVLSGVLFWGEFAWDGWSVVPYSLVYNLIYCLPDFAIAVVGLVALFSSKSFTTALSSQLSHINSNKIHE